MTTGHELEDGSTPGSNNGNLFRSHLRAIRIQQWLKNLLVFVAPVMAHMVMDATAIGLSVLAFLSFSLCASATYLLNDIYDLPADRKHPSKRFRPIAAGQITTRRAAILIPVLLGFSFALALLLPVTFLGLLGVYLFFTIAYSLRLKRTVVIDVLVLAGLYTLRILAGGAATSTPVSFWLLVFSMFLFLSLGMMKRYAELDGLIRIGGDSLAGRGYQAVDLETLAQFGSSAAFLSVLVLALYVNSDAVGSLYSNPEIIWLVCPLMLYLMGRVWLLARRGEVNEDPLVFLLEDGPSQGVILLGAILFWLAV
jgi:4-hydroxybenzoate polyprenyltransferase